MLCIDTLPYWEVGNGRSEQFGSPEALPSAVGVRLRLLTGELLSILDSVILDDPDFGGGTLGCK